MRPYKEKEALSLALEVKAGRKTELEYGLEMLTRRHVKEDEVLELIKDGQRREIEMKDGTTGYKYLKVGMTAVVAVRGNRQIVVTVYKHCAHLNPNIALDFVRATGRKLQESTILKLKSTIALSFGDHKELKKQSNKEAKSERKWSRHGGRGDLVFDDEDEYRPYKHYK